MYDHILYIAYHGNLLVIYMCRVKMATLVHQEHLELEDYL